MLRLPSDERILADLWACACLRWSLVAAAFDACLESPLGGKLADSSLFVVCFILDRVRVATAGAILGEVAGVRFGALEPALRGAIAGVPGLREVKSW